jgi:ADP-dependent phosphofructokinase/glucokinase
MDHTGKFGYLTGSRSLPYSTSEEKVKYRESRIEAIELHLFSTFYTIVGAYQDESAQDQYYFEARNNSLKLLEDELNEIDECLRRLGVLN